ncbi:MAG: serine hydrolase domain-containing protein [Gammaproteobacteria bacterium]
MAWLAAAGSAEPLRAATLEATPAAAANEHTRARADASADAVASADAGADAGAGAGAARARARGADALFTDFTRPGSPGLALGIWHNGKVAYRQSYGRANLEQHTPITSQTVFHVASLSKQFTALSIALLARDGKLKLDDDVRRYLPYVPPFGITLDNLVHHTSGLRDQWLLFDLAGHEGVRRQHQVVNMVARQRGLNFAPGTDYAYSNTGYTLLAETVAAVSGKSFRQFTQEQVFAPLGMSHSFFYDDYNEIVPNRAESYEPAPKSATGWQRIPLNYETFGATSLHTTLDDMMLYVAHLSRPVIGDAALQTQLRAPGHLRDGSPVNYGFGLLTRDYAGHKAVLHTGADAGFAAIVAYLPADDFGVVILTNTPMDLHEPVTKIVNIWLNDGAPLRPPVLAPAALLPKARLAEIAGRYTGPADRLITLDLQGDTLVWKTLTNTGEKVVFRKDGSFDLDEREWNYYRLRRGPRGEILGFDSIDSRGQETTKLYRRLPADDLPRPPLDELAGDYHSEELDITYQFRVESGQLIARSLWRFEPVRFTAVAADRFESSEWWIPILTVRRDASGKPAALLVTSSRARAIVLDRVPSAK